MDNPWGRSGLATLLSLVHFDEPVERLHRSQIKVRVVVGKEGLTFLVQREVDEEDAMMKRRQCLVGVALSLSVV